MTAEFATSTRHRAVLAWVDSLPRSVPYEVLQRLVAVFGTRSRRGRGGASSPFQGVEDLPTLDCLAEELPPGHQEALLRQILVRRMVVECALGMPVDMAGRFSAEIGALMRVGEAGR
jgi:hypothetical protein